MRLSKKSVVTIPVVIGSNRVLNAANFGCDRLRLLPVLVVNRFWLLVLDWSQTSPGPVLDQSWTGPRLVLDPPRPVPDQCWTSPRPVPDWSQIGPGPVAVVTSYGCELVASNSGCNQLRLFPVPVANQLVLNCHLRLRLSDPVSVGGLHVISSICGI